MPENAPDTTGSSAPASTPATPAAPTPQSPPAAPAPTAPSLPPADPALMGTEQKAGPLPGYTRIATPDTTKRG
jgi:hypothetical protein